ncbi:MAG: efflux RND transporter periplasmic adaptor subunit [Acidobacteriota bacterium]
MTKLRTILHTLGLCGIALVSMSCGETPQEELATLAPVPVVIETVTRGDLHREISASGVVAPAAGAELVVTAPQSARIAELPHGVGDRVRRGDLLVRFEIPALQSDAAGRRADAARAAARLAQAQSNFDRVQGLFERGIAAQREVEDARRELSDATAGLAEAKASEAGSSELAARRTVRAPFDGVVAERRHNPGDLVEPSGEAVIRLIDPARLEVVAQIPASMAGWLEAGDSATVNTAEAASLISRPAAIDSATSTATVRLAFATATKLASGTAVEVTIAADLHRAVVLVPAGAVVQEGPDSFVYTVDAAMKAHRQPVEIGISTRSRVEIVKGLDEHARIVVEGENGLPDGAEVTPQAEDAKPATEPAPETH